MQPMLSQPSRLSLAPAPGRKPPYVGFGLVLLALSLAVSATGCEKVKSSLGRATIPNLGPQIPVTAKIDFDPSLTKAMLQYTNACNSPQQLRVGEESQESAS